MRSKIVKNWLMSKFHRNLVSVRINEFKDKKSYNSSFQWYSILTFGSWLNFVTFHFLGECDLSPDIFKDDIKLKTLSIVYQSCHQTWTVIQTWLYSDSANLLSHINKLFKITCFIFIWGIKTGRDHSHTKSNDKMSLHIRWSSLMKMDAWARKLLKIQFPRQRTVPAMPIISSWSVRGSRIFTILVNAFSNMVNLHESTIQ